MALPTTDSLRSNAPDPLAVDDDEGAHRVGLGKTKFRELLNSGEIGSFYVGRRRLIPVSELERFVAERMAATA
jgi:excisionase family DNA binding protein